MPSLRAIESIPDFRNPKTMGFRNVLSSSL